MTDDYILTFKKIFNRNGNSYTEDESHHYNNRNHYFFEQMFYKSFRWTCRLNSKSFFIKNVSETEDEPVVLEGEGKKPLIPSEIIDIWAGLEVLLGLKPSEGTDTSTEGLNLLDEIYKEGEI